MVGSCVGTGGGGAGRTVILFPPPLTANGGRGGVTARGGTAAARDEAAPPGRPRPASARSGPPPGGPCRRGRRHLICMRNSRPYSRRGAAVRTGGGASRAVRRPEAAPASLRNRKAAMPDQRVLS